MDGGGARVEQGASSPRPTSSRVFPPSRSPPRSQPSSSPRDLVSACRFCKRTRTSPGCPLLCGASRPPSRSGRSHPLAVIRECLHSLPPSISPARITPLFLLPRRQTHESSFNLLTVLHPFLPHGLCLCCFLCLGHSTSCFGWRPSLSLAPAGVSSPVGDRRESARHRLPYLFLGGRVVPQVSSVEVFLPPRMGLTQGSHTRPSK